MAAENFFRFTVFRLLEILQGADIASGAFLQKSVLEFAVKILDK